MINMKHLPNLDDYECKWYDFNGVKFPYWDQLPLKIGVKMSGGIDSATIMYILAYLKTKNLLHPQSTLHGFTAQNWNRPYQVVFINKTLELIKQKLNDIYKILENNNVIQKNEIEILNCWLNNF